MEVIGKKHVMLAGLGIAVTDAAQRDRAAVGLTARDEKGLIAAQVRVLGNPVAPDDPVSGVALLPSDKEDSSIVQGVKPSKIGIGAIHDDDAARRQVQDVANGDIMSKPSRTGEKLVDSMRKNKAADAQDFPVRALARRGLGLQQYCIGTADRREL